jgi:hypothetical protein
MTASKRVCEAWMVRPRTIHFLARLQVRSILPCVHG